MIARRALAARSTPHGDEPRTTEQAERERLYRRLLALADVLSVAVALLVLTTVGDRTPTPAALLIAPAMVVLAKATGLYDRDELLIRRSTLDEVPRLFHAATFAAFAMWLGQGVLLDAVVAAPTMAATWVALLGSLVATRWTARAIAGAIAPPERCLVVGDACDLARLRPKVDDGRVRLLGHVPLDRVVADPELLRRSVREHDAHRLIVAPPYGAGDDVTSVIREAKATGLRVSVMPGILEVVGSSVTFDDLPGLTLLGVRRVGLSRSSRALKRSFDVLVAATLLVVLAPVLLVIALAIKLTSPGPVLFTQVRVGRDGRPFRILKLRTMVRDAETLHAGLTDRNEAVGGLFKIADDPRITPIGRWLRRTSLDEVPQFLNVLRGEMSLVGPRPLVVLEDERVLGRDRHRLSMTPGVTGPWQIAGSSRVPLPEMVQMDYLYLATWSLWSDVKICVRTVRHMAMAQGQ